MKLYWDDGEVGALDMDEDQIFMRWNMVTGERKWFPAAQISRGGLFLSKIPDEFWEDQ